MILILQRIICFLKMVHFRIGLSRFWTIVVDRVRVLFVQSSGLPPANDLRARFSVFFGGCPSYFPLGLPFFWEPSWIFVLF